jgi:molecular chaperone GrpE
MMKKNNKEKETVENVESKANEQVTEESVENSATQPAAEQAKQLDTTEETQAAAENPFETKFNEMQDKYLRLSAEFDNYRKRTLKEKTDLIRSGGEDVLKAILPIIDDIERAVASMEKTEDMNSVKEGVKLIFNKFNDFLTQRGVTPIEALNCEFNVDLHEAITKIPAPTPELAGKVVDVVQNGYMLNDKVLRYSKVVIGE